MVRRAMKLDNRWWAIVVALLACGYALERFDWRKVGDTLAGISLLPLIIETSAVTLAIFAACTLRWIAISGLPWRGTVIRDVYIYIAVVIGTSAATPMQLGEMLKIKFARDSGLPFGSAVVSLALERLIDLAAIGGMAVGGLAYVIFGSLALTLATVAVSLAAGLAAPALLQWVVARFAHMRLGGETAESRMRIPRLR